MNKKEKAKRVWLALFPLQIGDIVKIVSANLHEYPSKFIGRFGKIEKHYHHSFYGRDYWGITFDKTVYYFGSEELELI